MKRKYIDYSNLIIVLLSIICLFSLIDFIIVPDLVSLFLVVPGSYLLIVLGYLICEILFVNWAKKEKITNGKRLALTIIKILLLGLFLFRSPVLDLTSFTINYFVSIIFLITMCFDLAIYTYDLISNEKNKENDIELKKIKYIIPLSIIFALMLAIALIDCFAGNNVNLFLVIIFISFLVITIGEIIGFIFNKKYYLANGLIVIAKTVFLIRSIFTFSFVQSVTVLFGSIHSFLVLCFYALMIAATIISWLYFIKSIKIVRKLFEQTMAS